MAKVYENAYAFHNSIPMDIIIAFLGGEDSVRDAASFRVLHKHPDPRYVLQYSFMNVRGEASHGSGWTHDSDGDVEWLQDHNFKVFRTVESLGNFKMEFPT